MACSRHCQSQAQGPGTAPHRALQPLPQCCPVVCSVTPPSTPSHVSRSFCLSFCPPGSHSHPSTPGGGKEGARPPAGVKPAAPKNPRGASGPQVGAGVPGGAAAGPESEAAEACQVVWTPALCHPCASRLPSDLCRLGALSLHGPVSRQRWSQTEGLCFVGT